MTSLQKPDAIFFDWDGTLVDSLPALHSYYNHVLGAFAKPSIELDEAKRRIRKSAREVFPEVFGDQADEALKVFYDFVEKSHLDHLTPFDRGHDFLQELSALGNLTLGVVSNKRHLFLLKEINHLGWDRYLVSNVGAGEASQDKPAADPILLAIKRAGLSPDTHHIWYVGDTETDMLAGQAAGCQIVFIEHGLGTRAECEQAGIHPYFVAGFDEFMDLVKKFF